MAPFDPISPRNPSRIYKGVRLHPAVPGLRTPPPQFSLYAPITRGLQADWPPTPLGGWFPDSPTTQALAQRASRLASHSLSGGAPAGETDANKENDPNGRYPAPSFRKLANILIE